MSRSSGFVPIKFRLAGKILLLVGVAGLLLTGLAGISGWFVVPSMVLYMSLAAIPISLYLIFVVPLEN
jgi:hypothetical protein